MLEQLTSSQVASNRNFFGWAVIHEAGHTCCGCRKGITKHSYALVMPGPVVTDITSGRFVGRRERCYMCLRCIEQAAGDRPLDYYARVQARLKDGKDLFDD